MSDPILDHDPCVVFELALRPANVLRRAQITTVRTLASLSAVDLLALPGFGRRSLVEVRDRLSEVGLALRGECARCAGPHWRRDHDAPQ